MRIFLLYFLKTVKRFPCDLFLKSVNEYEDLLWLREYKDYELSDNEARALLIAMHLGAVNNSTLREDTNLDTLQASHVLQKLTKELGLLKKHGAGSATTYTLKSKRDYLKAETPHLEFETPHLKVETPHFEVETSESGMVIPNRKNIPENLEDIVNNLGYRPKKEKVFSVIAKLCLCKPKLKKI